jgi:hypothetical protein
LLKDIQTVMQENMTIGDYAAEFGQADLPGLVNGLYDEIESILNGASDQDVTFVPEDPEANDPPGEGWTLGHVIVHVTAGVEEAAALSSALARGVEVDWRSRWETPWDSISSASQLQQRLAESRRMVLAFLNTWPDEPHVDMTYTPVERFGPMNAVGRMLFGMMHGQGHLAQLRRIREQAAA